jgi:uncharacterized protein (TIGR03083 family)
MEPLPYHAAITHDTSLLLDALVAGPIQAVPTCPGWTIGRLAGHVGRVHRMAARIVRLELKDPPASTHLLAPPDHPDDLAEYVRSGLAEVLDALENAEPNAHAWNMVGAPFQASFWSRRLAHETAVHRADAQLAAGLPLAPVHPDLAIDGIDEYFALIPNRVLAARSDASLGGSLHLHATDGPGEWMIEIESGVLTVTHGHGKGAAAIRGTASDLLFGVWGRLGMQGPQFECFGNPEVRDRFVEIGAF